MSEILKNATISQELYSNTDHIFNTSAIPANTASVSNVFELGKTLNALELVGAVMGEVTIASDLTVSVAKEDTATGAFSTFETIATIPSGTYAAGEELFRYVADHTQPVYYKVKLETTDASASGTFRVDIASVRK